MTDRHAEHWKGRHYDAYHIAGPVSFLNPTARLHSIAKPATPDEKPGAASSSSSNSGDPVYAVWRSRDNRKGRHAVAIAPSAVNANAGVALAAPAKSTSTWPAIVQGIARMVLRYPVWDVSYDVAVVFTLGSIVWVINGFFVLVPAVDPAASFSGESTWGGGVSAVVGATIFEVGSVLLMLEAVNENRSECFGWAVERSADDLLTLTQDKSRCRHHHVEKSHDGDVGAKTTKDGKGSRTWTWCPSWYELKTHYFRDIGFLACFFQMLGATVFWISGFTGLPQILSVLSVPATDGIYWLPQVIGGSGFIISSWLFMLETQKKWYLPAPTVLGWHMGFWNLVGALGFTFCGAFGFASSNDVYDMAAIWSTFIGSWAFLIGSVVQWYESLDKYPVIVDNTTSAASQLTPDKTNADV
ncbi:hypothetical protein BD289DRAFT_366452 [Coniella lustricola]|uniref:Integral membrane protein n=1 Tax=Coniella lustricola TaxID=2025994 RepID=A0A2T3AB16_9PEZI|nr:hypothetical protein BD289DRAFT_366452 [Coniella lustricola]